MKTAVIGTIAAIMAGAAAFAAAAEDADHVMDPRPIRPPPSEVGAGAWTAQAAGGPVEISASLEALDGGAPRARRMARLRLVLKDAATGKPVIGAAPLAWMQTRRNEQVAAETDCAAKASLFQAGALSARADVDFNAFRLVTIDRAKSVGVVDPGVSFRTQLESVTPLPGAPERWALSADGRNLFVTMPAVAAAARINLETSQIERLLTREPGVSSGALAVEPRSGRLWRTIDNRRLAVTEMDGETPVATIAASPSAVLAFGSDHAVVAQPGDTQLALFNLSGFERRVAQLEFAPREIVADGGQAYALEPTGSRVGVIELGSAKVRYLPLASGARSLRVTPDGFYLLALVPGERALLALSLISGRVVARAQVVRDPVELVAEHGFAIVRADGGATLSVVALDLLESGRPNVAEIPLDAGRAARNAAPAPGPFVAFAPHGMGVLTAGPGAHEAAYYMPGMNAPMGSVRLYASDAVALLPHDRTLAELAPGVYETTARLADAGPSDLVVLLDRPRLSRCLVTSVAPSQEAAPARRLTPFVESVCAKRVDAGKPVRVAFRLLDRVTYAPIRGLHDVEILLAAPPRSWQLRQRAHESGDGVYESEFQIERTGRVAASVASVAGRLGFADAAPEILEVR